MGEHDCGAALRAGRYAGKVYPPGTDPGTPLMVATDELSLQFGKLPTLIGAEYAFTFQNMYLGLSPYDAPATYSLLQYTELAEGGFSRDQVKLKRVKLV